MKLLLSTRDYPTELAELGTWTSQIAERLAVSCEDFALLRIGGGTASLANAGTLLETVALPSPAFNLAAMAALELGGVRPGRFDVVLGTDWLSAALGLAWRGRARLRGVFAAVHGPELDMHGRRGSWPFGAVYRRSCARTLARCEAVLPTSGHARGLMQRLERPVRRIELVGSGCDVERFSPTARGALARELGLSERRVLLSVGPLVLRRQIDKLLFAVSALGVRYPDLCCVIVGEGPERERLQRLAKRLRIEHRCRFLGAVSAPSLPAVYNLSDVVVQLSGGPAAGAEGAASVLLQALACGKPVVTTTSAASEDVLDADTGVVVPDDDSTALAEALTGLLDQPALARQLGERGRARVVASASWDRVAERLRHVLASADAPRERSLAVSLAAHDVRPRPLADPDGLAPES
jgi:phosphatidylinositol alpha-1,6-mannosyltransferase